MKREDNERNVYKNEDTNLSTIFNKSFSEIDPYTSKISDIEKSEEDDESFSKIEPYTSNIFDNENSEEDTKSLSEIDISKIFEFPYNSKDDEDDIDEEDLYFLKDGKTSTNQNENREKFKISTKKRGRKKEKKEIKLNKKRKEKSHNKYDKDNLLRKCQISYFNFIIKFLNILIKLFNSKLKIDPKKKFIPIDYAIKKIVNRDQKNKLHTNSIEDMIKNDISPKYKKSRTSSNKDLCEEIKQCGIPEIENVFKKNFIFLFDIYHKSIRSFNLKDLDEDLENLKIEIPENVELYKDLLNKNMKDVKFEEYKALMESYIKNYFECNILFSIKA